MSTAAVSAPALARPTLGYAWWPRTGLRYDALRVVIGSLFMALLAQVSVPFWPVPLTGQTLGALLVGAALGSRLGALAMLLYLAEGMLGLPVFANGRNAWVTTPTGPYIFGTTAGYLAGFVVAAGLVGWLAERGWDRKVLTTVAAMVLGNLVIWMLGAGWLAVVLGSVERAWLGGVQPFLLGDAVKIAIAAAVLPGAWSVLGRAGKGQ